MGRSELILVGIDTGGTFTDIVAVGPDGRRAAKVPSTPASPEIGFLAALGALFEDLEGVRIRHGTTVGTNAVLTRRGARIAFVTTAGFEDLPWIGRGQREDLHALRPQRVGPLLERGMSFGLEERIDAKGRVVTAPAASKIEQLQRLVARSRPEAIAVNLLHAVQNDAHERRVREALAGLDVPVHTSAAVCADPREVERGATVLLDAYVSPVLRSYLQAVSRGLPPAVASTMTVMRSDGGRMSIAEVAAAPVRTLLSGPAAGVAAARALALRLGEKAVLSFDVGGTSTDVAWIEGADLSVRTSLSVGAFEASVPSVGLETVGAGGGSVVHLDSGGALCVGPESAGADPGPACYGRGGPFTLTDAWLMLGVLPKALLGGAFPLSRKAAEQVARPVARAAGLSLPRLLKGVVAVAATTTARALRLASVAHGRDPRGAALIAFGGAGPVLAAETAALLGLRTVYVPPDPGTFAAEGTLLAPLRADAAEVVTSVRPGGLAMRARQLGVKVRRALREEGARRVSLRAEIDARYRGQAFEVTVPFGARWQHAFHDRHAAKYGFATPERVVEAVRLRVRGEGHEGRLDRAGPRGAGLVPRRFRTWPLRRVGRAIAAVTRADLGGGRRLVGPVRVEELSGTTWIPAGWVGETLGDGTLRLRRKP